MILSTILPGVRNLRAPLAAGYVWILFAWLVAHLGTADAHPGLTEDLAKLGDALSPAGLAVAVSFLAYLIGSFSKSLFDSLAAVTTKRLDVAGLTRLSERGHDVLDDLLAQHLPAGLLASPSDAGELASEIVDELDLIKSRLLESKRDLFDEIDRLQAEAELRFALLPPLLAVGVVAVLSIPLGSMGGADPSHFAGKFLLVCGVVVLIEIFAYQAIASSRKANDKIIDAVLLEQVSAPAVDRWQREMEQTA